MCLRLDRKCHDTLEGYKNLLASLWNDTKCLSGAKWSCDAGTQCVADLGSICCNKHIISITTKLSNLDTSTHQVDLPAGQ